MRFSFVFLFFFFYTFTAVAGSNCFLRDSVFGTEELENPSTLACWQMCGERISQKNNQLLSRDLSAKIKLNLEQYPEAFLDQECFYLSGAGKEVPVIIGTPSLRVVKDSEKGLNFSVSMDIKNADLSFMQSKGIGAVRLRIDPEIIFNWERTELVGEEVSRLLGQLDKLNAHGINVIVDMHKLTGFNLRRDLKTEGSVDQTKFITLWASLANELKSFEKITLELFNEPELEGAWWTLQKKVVDAIRATGFKNDIIVNGDNFAEMAQLLRRGSVDLIKDPKVIYNFHFYDPMIFSHQFRVSSTIKAEDFDARLRNVPWPLSQDHMSCLRLLSGSTETIPGLTLSPLIRLTAGERHLGRTCNGQDFEVPIMFYSHVPSMSTRVADPSDSGHRLYGQSQAHCDSILVSEQILKLVIKGKRKFICSYGNTERVLVYQAFQGPIRTRTKAIGINDLERNIKQVVAWATKHKVRIMANEFGARNTATLASRERYFNDVTTLFNKYGINWYIWEYRMDGWFGFAMYDEVTDQVTVDPHILQGLHLTK